MGYGKPVGWTQTLVPANAIDGFSESIRVQDPTTGAGILTGNTDPLVVSIDPLTGANAPVGTDTGPGAYLRSSWKRLVLNGDFAVPPPNINKPINSDQSSADYNPLPGWIFHDNSNGAIVLTWVADTSSGSGGTLLWTATNAAAGAQAWLSQIVPTRTTRTQNSALQVISSWFGHSGSSPVQGFHGAQSLKADAVTTTGSLSTAFWTSAADVYFTSGFVPPADAGWLSLLVGCANTDIAAHSGSIKTSEVVIIDAPAFTLWPDLGGGYDPVQAYADGNTWILSYDNNTQMQMAIGSYLYLPYGQIAFPATQNPSSNANTLDDYEEGTWTPVADFATHGNLSTAYSTQTGWYTKIGDMVFAEYEITTTTFTFTTASGNFEVTGLPFTVDSVGMSMGATEGTGYGSSGVTYILNRPNASTTNATFRGESVSGLAGSSSAANLGVAAFTTATNITFRGICIYHSAT